MPQRFDDPRDFWDHTAHDWDIQVGNEGDRNRLLNSDPVLWRFAGDIAGKRVLDAGCGTAYLSRQLAERGAIVTGIDFSERMIEIARERSPGIAFRVDSCSELQTCEDASFDLLVSNYVLMDLPDLDGAIAAFHRVLCPGGIAVLVFSHPCFPAGRIVKAPKGKGIAYHWPEPYFVPARRTDPPWGHFTADFIWYHRPLSDYFKAFFASGFSVTGFEEPRLTADRAHLAQSPRELDHCSTRPYSVALQLRKGSRHLRQPA